MGIATILVSLNETDRVDELLKVAAGLSSRHDAHLIGLFVVPAVYLLVFDDASPGDIQTESVEGVKE